MADQILDILELEPTTAIFVHECEVSGKRAIITRKNRPVAILIAMDEYVALRETVDLVATAKAQRTIVQADEQIRRGELLSVEDLLVE